VRRVQIDPQISNDQTEWFDRPIDDRHPTCRGDFATFKSEASRTNRRWEFDRGGSERKHLTLNSNELLGSLRHRSATITSTVQLDISPGIPRRASSMQATNGHRFVSQN